MRHLGKNAGTGNKNNSRNYNFNDDEFDDFAVFQGRGESEPEDAGKTYNFFETPKQTKNEPENLLEEEFKAVLPKEKPIKRTSEPEGERRRRKTNIITIAIVAAAAVVMGFAAYNLITIGSGYAKDANLYESMRNYAISDDAESVSAEGVLQGRKVIDFSKLEAVNPDIIAWIEIPDTNLSYPIVKGENNEFYLTHGADKEERKSGAIFADAQSDPNFTDTNTLVYGHNMKDGSMFAMLHNYEKQAYYGEHPLLYIYLKDGSVKEYTIFSAYKTSGDSDAYLGGVMDEAAYNKYVSDAAANSEIETGIQPAYGDNLILLSTCVTGDYDSRYIIHAKENKS